MMWHSFVVMGPIVRMQPCKPVDHPRQQGLGDDCVLLVSHFGSKEFSADDELPMDEVHVERMAQIRAEGLAAIEARQARQQQQKEAMKRIQALRDT